MFWVNGPLRVFPSISGRLPESVRKKKKSKFKIRVAAVSFRKAQWPPSAWEKAVHSVYRASHTITVINACMCCFFPIWFWYGIWELIVLINNYCLCSNFIPDPKWGSYYKFQIMWPLVSNPVYHTTYFQESLVCGNISTFNRVNINGGQTRK